MMQESKHARAAIDAEYDAIERTQAALLADLKAIAAACVDAVAKERLEVLIARWSPK